MKQCNVLIVDDSATMRALIAATLRNDPQINIIGEAADPFEGREAIKKLAPDVVTLDIEMPRMNGLEFLEKIMRLRPTRVIIVSSLTEAGAAATIKALEIGAVDCVAKPSIGNPRSFEDLAQRIKGAASAPLRRLARLNDSLARVEPMAPGGFAPDGRIVAVGSSMGGVEALCALLSTFPENCPPTVITQHMPPLFTKSFAQRLDKSSKPRVCEASDGAPLMAGRVYIAPGGASHLEVTGSSALQCRLREGEPVSGHRPSIDVMFRSVARAAGKKSVGVILTGMGRDGAQGLLAMRTVGAETIGQDEATSLVYGMPRAAFELGGVVRQLPLEKIAAHILLSTNALNARETCR
jgi:two-component system chemotaxis response regulator CheB